MNSSKRVALCVETTIKYIYPQVADLAELLARRGFEVTVFCRHDPEAESWNQGRGFSYAGVRRPERLPGKLWNPFFIAHVLPQLPAFAGVVTFTSPTLPLALAADRMLRIRALHVALELHVPGDPSGTGYARFQHGLRHAARVRVFTTGAQRSRLLAKAYGLRSVPGEFLNASLAKTRVRPVYQGPTIAEQVRRLSGQEKPIIVLCNGGLDDLNMLDRIVGAQVPAASGVAVALIGPCGPAWRERLAAAHALTGNYHYLGELPGTRYDVIRAAAGVDAGFALKRADKSLPANDRLYTPNKLFDLLAAGAAPIVSRQSSLRFVSRERFGICLDDLTIEGLRRFLLSLPGQRGALSAMRARGQALFAARYNLERTASEVVEALQ